MDEDAFGAYRELAPGWEGNWFITCKYPLYKAIRRNGHALVSFDDMFFYVLSRW